MTDQTANIGAVLPRLRREFSALTLREFAVGVVRGYGERHLLILGCGIAFRLSLALIPLMLCALGMVGFLGFSEIWTADLAPRVAAGTSLAAFTVVDDTVTMILGQGRLFWVTAGALIALWQASGVVRAAIKGMNDVYDVEEERPLVRRITLSIGLAVALILIFTAAVASFQLGRPAAAALLGGGGFAGLVGLVLGWLIGLGLLVLAMGLLVRAGPDLERPVHWVSGGAVLVVALWVTMSIAVALYLTQLADYGSVYGNFTTVFVLLEYLFLSAMSFLTGLLVDALIWERIGDDAG